jgi:hypothetical protein
MAANWSGCRRRPGQRAALRKLWAESLVEGFTVDIQILLALENGRIEAEDASALKRWYESATT